MREDSSKSILSQLPTKWAVAVLVIAIGYALAQPALNNKLGWNLPSIGSLVSDDNRNERGGAGQSEARSDPKNAGPGNGSDSQQKEQSKKEVSSASGSSGETQNSNNSTSGAENASSKPAGLPSSPGARGPPPQDQAAPDAELRYGLLKSIGDDRYVSAGGLIYGPGSQEGHRLKHLERHLKDQPNRSGPHGVFYGDMPQVIRWLDDTYDRASSGAKGTSRKQDGRRVVL